MKLSHAATIAFATAAALGLSNSSAHAQTTSYYSSGFYDYIVGSGVTTVDVTLAGASGGSLGYGAGGTGGLMTAQLSGLTTGEDLRFIIGEGEDGTTDPTSNGSSGAGYNGGGRGGELSAIAFGSGTNLSTLNFLLIAGGGGGADGGDGGAGGGLVGGDGNAAPIVGAPSAGLGGTQSAGGAPGTAAGANAAAGSFLQGGAASDSGSVYQDTGGGGGGGYYGGGGATGTAGGGGGSSYSSAAPVDGVTISDVVDTQGGAVPAENNPDLGINTPGSVNGAGYATITVVSDDSSAPEPDSIAFAVPALSALGVFFLRRRKAQL